MKKYNICSRRQGFSSNNTDYTCKINRCYNTEFEYLCFNKNISTIFTATCTKCKKDTSFYFIEGISTSDMIRLVEYIEIII